MLGEAASQAFLAAAPAHTELALLYSAHQPVEARASSFASGLAEDPIGSATGSAAASLRRGGRLRVP